MNPAPLGPVAPKEGEAGRMNDLNRMHEELVRVCVSVS